ncbi:MAG: DUF2341 domain-containing protein, partial [Methanolinea sp.]|nr:DUF2341 domain-containing protein [Methanolinea sp.]
MKVRKITYGVIIFTIFLSLCIIGTAAGNEIEQECISCSGAAIQATDNDSQGLVCQVHQGPVSQVDGENDDDCPPLFSMSLSTPGGSDQAEESTPPGSDLLVGQVNSEIITTPTQTVFPSIDPAITPASPSLADPNPSSTMGEEIPCLQCTVKQGEKQGETPASSLAFRERKQKELENIQSAIKAQGKKWVAGWTSVFDLPDNERKNMLGLIHVSTENSFSSEGGSGVSPENFSSGIQSVPPSLDWRVNGGDFTTPIRNQGDCGSCWAFATLGTLESRMEIAYNNPNLNPDFAEQDLLSCPGCGSCDGATMSCPLNWVLNQGVMNESCFPYKAQVTTCNPGCSRANRISEWHRIYPLNNEAAIKDALTRGPIIGTFVVYSDFYSYKTGIYENTTDDFEGYHAIVIVGYGQDGGGTYWICKNSWGTGWGEAGWFKIRSGNCEINNELYELTVSPVPGPIAEFKATPATGVAPLSVQFTDLSSNSPTAWQWNFGDGTSNATVQNPVHNYTAAGTYTVTLTVSNSYGSNTTRKSNYITVTPPPPFLSGWSYRKLHTISGSSSPLTDYQVRFKVWNTTGTDTGENVYLGTKVNPDFSDVRFTTTDNTVLSYWVQETGSNYAIVWVRVPSIPTTGTQFYLYYGNPAATSLSNGDATFLFFDDFEGTSLNATKWNIGGSTPTVIVSGGVVTVTASKSAYQGIYSKATFGGNHVIMGKWKQATTSSVSYPAIGFNNADASRQVIIFARTDGSNKFQGKTLSGSSYTFIDLFGPLDTNWHNVEVYRISSTSATFVIDGTTRTTSSTIPSDSLPAAITSWGTPNSAICDRIAVRKHVSPEPAVVTWGTESVNPVPPSVQFSASPTSGQYPLTVQFTDLSSNSPTAWQWNFGDGTSNATVQNPVHNYTAAGTYTV